MNRYPLTKYRPSYCDDVVDFLKEGYSLAAFAGRIGVTHRALYDWIDRYPDFAEAVKQAQAKSALWWEQRVIEVAQGGQGNAGAIMFGLRNRAPAEWRDKTHTEVTGRVEQVHRIERVLVRPEHSDR
jgi:transposase